MHRPRLRPSEVKKRHAAMLGDAGKLIPERGRGDHGSLCGRGTARAFIHAGLIICLGSGCTRDPHLDKAAPLQIKADSQIAITWEPSPDGLRFALPLTPAEADPEGHTSIVLIDTMKPAKADTYVSLDWASSPAWRPDGKAVAFVYSASKLLVANEPALGHATGIGVYSFESGSQRKSPVNGLNRDLAWRPNGKQLAYAHLIMEPNKLSGKIRVASLEATGLGQAVDVGAGHDAVGMPTWRPQRDELAYIGYTSSIGLVPDADVWLANLNTSVDRNLSHSGDVARYSLAWSHDGRFLAYATDRRGEKAADSKPRARSFAFRNLVVLDMITGHKTVLLRSTDLPPAFKTVSALSWDSKGARLLFQGSVGEPEGPADIGTLTWPEGHLTWLTHDHTSRAPRWEIGSSNVVFIRGKSEVWSISGVGSHKQRLFTLR